MAALYKGDLQAAVMRMATELAEVKNSLHSWRFAASQPPRHTTQSPNPDPAPGRVELDDLRRAMAERLELSIEKQRLAMAGEARIREARMRDDVIQELYQIKAAFEDRERKMRLEYEEELCRTGRESVARDSLEEVGIKLRVRHLPHSGPGCSSRRPSTPPCRPPSRPSWSPQQ